MKLYKVFSTPPFFMSASHYMKKDDSPVKSTKKSRKAVIVPLILMQYGSLKQKFATFKNVGPIVWLSIKQMRRSACGLVNNPKQGTKKMDVKTLQELENYAKELGVSKIGFTKVKPDFIFDKFEILYDNAMILSMEMEREAIKNGPSEAATDQIWKSYSGLGVTVNKLACFLRERGFNCHPSPALGGDVCTIPIAQDAGIGAVGKNGLLITPEFGASHRLAAIFIDADNLPLKNLEDNDHLWIKDFCETCDKCVKACPGKAIYKQTKILKDGNPSFVDREKCALPFSSNCATCIAKCPFIQGNYDKIKASFDRTKGVSV